MYAINLSIRALLCSFAIVHSAIAQTVLEDNGVSVSEGELAFMVSGWPEQMQRAAANDLGDRLELLNKVIVLKKMAAAADALAPGPELWALSDKLLVVKREFMLDDFIATATVPDMSALSAERYDTQRRKYALVPEKRLSSQILFICARPCDRQQTAKEAQEVLDELRAGADFAELVQTHSGDPTSRAKRGEVDSWITYGDQRVPPTYSEELFNIASIGEYSELVGTDFGIHILRYDAVEEEHFLSYDEAKEQIIADLETEYRKLSILEFIAQFNVTDDLFIDGDAMEKVFAPYKSADN
jgi:hypothetical protein